MSAASASSTNARFTPWRVAALLALVVFAAFPDVVLGSATLYYRDYGCFGYPLAFYHRQSFWQGEIPLWNPLNNCGLPFLAQWNTLVLYPLSAIYLLLPLPWSLGIFCLLHLLLAGVSMHALAHRWTGNHFAASLAAVAYAFNGLTLHALMWPNNIAALAWLPLVVLYVQRARAEGGRTILLAAGVASLQMLAGAPEIILFTWLLAGAVVVADCGWRMADWRKQWRTLVVGLIVVGLTAAQMFPFLDLLAHSHRDKNFADSVWSMPAWGLANLLVPLFRCTPAMAGVFSQDEQQWTSSYYLGIGALALALLAVWRFRDRQVWLLAVVALVSLVLALGDHGFLYTGLKKVFPAMGFVRFPIKFVVLAVVTVPLLAAFAVAGLERLPFSEWTRERRRALVLWGALLALVAGIVWWAHQSPQPFRRGDLLDVVRHSGLTRAALLSGILGGLLALRWAERRSLALALRLGILGLAALDALTHTPRQNPTVPPLAVARGLEPLQQNPQPMDGSRALTSRYMQDFLSYAGNSNALVFCVGQRQGLVPNWNLLDGVPVVTGFYSLYPKEHHEIWTLLHCPTNFPVHLADFVSATHLSSDEELFAWLSRPSALPFANAGQKPVFADASKVLGALAASSFDPRRTVYLPREAKHSINVSNQASARVVASHLRSHEIELEVSADEPALVTVAQTHYHWWKARVNGQPTPIWQANHAFQAIAVPRGRSVVKLVYDDRGFMLGTLVSLVTVLGCLGAWWKLRAQPLPTVEANQHEGG